MSKDESSPRKESNCDICGHPKDKHAFDIYSKLNPNKPCELSCTICFKEETHRLVKEDKIH